MTSSPDTCKQPQSSQVEVERVIRGQIVLLREYIPIREINEGGWEDDGSLVKEHLTRRPWVGSQQPHGSSQPSVIPGPGALTPTPGLWGHCTQEACIHAHRQNTNIWRKIFFKVLKFSFYVYVYFACIFAHVPHASLVSEVRREYWLTLELEVWMAVSPRGVAGHQTWVVCNANTSLDH